MSAFETILIHRGKFIFLPEHLAKLRHGCVVLGLRQPPEETSFLSLLTSHLSPFTLPLSGLLRVYITAGDGSFRDPLDHGRILLFLEETIVQPPPSNLRVHLASEPFHSPFPGLKTGHYWPHIAAYRTAADHSADEILLVNDRKHVISASLANVFAVMDGELRTSRTASGARAGVVRDWVIQREEVLVTDFHPEQLREASEIFLTNSIGGIRSVTHFDNQILHDLTIATRLQTAWQQMLEG